MKLGIMQPYFLPYIGYWQLMAHVDVFVVYDNIQYTKKGWINRNRYLCNGSDKYFTIPLKKDSDFLNVDERYISDTFDCEKLKNQIKMAYAKAPYFVETYKIFEKILAYEDRNLFNFLFNSIKEIKDYLQIQTEIVVSSTLDIDFELKGKDKVQAICKALQAEQYVNPIGGLELYDKTEFANNGIELSFLQSDLGQIIYEQFGDSFVQALSILDILMFNSVDEVKQMLGMYKIV